MDSMADGLRVWVLRRWCVAGPRIRRFVRDSAGTLLMETIIAVTIFITVSSAAVIGVSTAQRARASIERSAIAENLVRNQMENLFSLPYRSWPHTYASSTGLITSTPSGYSVTAVAPASTSTAGFATDPAFQKVIVTVSHQGKEILQVETLRSNR